MSVKELLTDSWNNMLKNNFILKFILVSLAYFLVMVLFIAVICVSYFVHPALCAIVAILGFIFFVPVSIATDKVLLDVFQGRDAKVFGFFSYGFKNAKRMWAIIGRTILKLLPLYLIKLVLFVVLCAYIVSSIMSIAKDITSGKKSTVYSSTTIDSLTSEVESLEGEIEDSLEDTLDSTLSTYDFSNYDFDSYSSLTDEDSLKDYTTSSSEADANALLNNLFGSDFQEAITEFMDQYGNIIVKNLAIIGLYIIVSLIVNILIVMKRLYYAMSYYLAFEDDNVTSRDAIEQSEELMKGNRAKYFWTFVLIYFAYIIISYVIRIIPSPALAGILALVLYVLYMIYISSYHFTFFKKLIGGGNAEVPVTEPVAEPVVTEPTVVEPESTVPEPTILEEKDEDTTTDEDEE